MLDTVLDRLEQRGDRTESGGFDVEPLGCERQGFDALDARNRRVPGDPRFVRRDESLGAVGERGVLDDGVGKALENTLVEVGIGFLIDDGAVVLPFEVEQSHGVSRGGRLDQPLVPLGDGVEFELRVGVAIEDVAQAVGRRRVSEPRAHDEPHWVVRSIEDVTETFARLSEREIEAGALDAPAPVVSRRLAFGFARRKAVNVVEHL